MIHIETGFMRYHVNPETGESGACSAQEGNCPFKAEHFASAEEARQAFEAKAIETELASDSWPPVGLPKKLHQTATFADLLRHENDALYEGAEGICLGASAMVSYDLIERDIPHKLVHGEYLVEGEAKPRPHWWVETSGWIIDPSRGQFPHDEYRSGVTRIGSPTYRKIEAWTPGHKSLELVRAEIGRCFSDQYEAQAYFDRALEIMDESKSII